MSDFAWPDTLARLLRGEDLPQQEAAAAMRSIMDGRASPAQVAGFLIGLRAKGETVDEVAGLAATMRELSNKVPVAGPLLDTCGTGGDRAGTVNISTMAALVVAGAGGRVAKHGNRAASSRCGSADLLEGLGVVIDLSPEDVATCIDEAGIGFCFAPVFHPAMRHAAVPRRELGVPTVFNFLGPLTNPAGAQRQTVGVSDPTMAPKMAEALRRLGAERAMVFRGDDGLDELTTTTTSTVWDIAPDGVAERRFDPEVEHSIARATAADLAGADVETNVKICLAVLEGEPGAVRDAVVLNAAAAMTVGGLAPSMDAALDAARESLDAGRARAAMERMRDVSRRLKG
ncbi:MAG TPA: anthranilate phosphoribosyltransferase [Actinomycetota bacterium]|nr:anthranilate phosphoribosyltransferase [Actinomycetota bacterium]